MFSLVRLAGIALLSALLLVPLWAANEPVDLLFGQTPSPIALSRAGEDVLSRLRDVRSEIRDDICRRGQKRFCLAGLCLPVPAEGCAHS